MILSSVEAPVVTSLGYNQITYTVTDHFLNLLKPKTYFIYHQLKYSEILCSAHTVYLCVLCGSQNKQRLFLYTALTYLFLKPKQRVFTARYGMDLYI